ncbi:Imidazoleglycerol-phosphate dehydratase [uncultured archaeon]|nr:Imidazoleglycerol-phosphate dehydratase [uncultured archaeon]
MKSSWKRETKETSIEVSLETDGLGAVEVETGIELLDEMLSAFAVGASLDLKVKARGDLETGDHHTTEDTGIALGSSLGQIIKRGMGSAVFPSGDCLATVAVRFGRAGYRQDFEFLGKEEGGMSLQNFGHFLRSLAYSGNFTLHARAEGGSDKSKVEAICTALGKALKRAIRDKS